MKSAVELRAGAPADSTTLAGNRARALCILGMHRSGTSSITRAMNLLGVYLGEDAKMMPPSADNPGGYWEHLEINDLHKRVMTRLERDWNTAEPLPENWLRSEAIRPFKEELAKLVAANFGGHALWGWKEPQTCLLLPLWREILEKAETKLSCLLVVRNPVDVASSLARRDAIPFDEALGIWFHYNVAALEDAGGLPIVFLNYDRLLASWEPEMRRCAAALGLDWPKDEPQYREAMNAFIQPGLRHNQSSFDRLQQLPHPVQELYHVLLEASGQPAVYDNRFEATIRRLSKDFRAYASLLANDANTLRRGLVMTWRTGRDLKFQRLRFEPRRPPPRLVHRLLGDKTCRSLCKRLAEACCWLLP